MGAMAGLALLMGSSCSTGAKWPLSDHFDGSRFHNPTGPEMPGLWGAIKFAGAYFRSAPWPESVENHPDLHLNPAPGQDQAAITFVNHATVLIQLPNLTILTDPIWSERAGPVNWFAAKRVRRPGIPFEQLPKIDLVLVSHNHYDHLDLDTLKRLNATFAPRFLVPLGNKALLESEGIGRVEELDWWDQVTLGPDSRVILTPAQHFSSRGLFDQNKSLWGSYLIQHDGRSVYFAGDTGYSSHFAEIRRRFGAVDLAFLPIGANEPRAFMTLAHMNPADAVQAHVDLGAQYSVPIHFGTFHLGIEPIDQPLTDLNAARAARGLSQEQFEALGEGRTHVFTFSRPRQVPSQAAARIAEPPILTH
ncbi:MAG: MBL fold metallo-hydrolase [SAR324 cluster bacterium]